MGDVFLKIFESAKKNDRILIYTMFLSIFFCFSFIMNANQSFVFIWKMLFGFDLSTLLLIMYRYLIFALMICSLGLLITLFLFAVLKGIDISKSILSSNKISLRTEISFGKSNKNVERFRIFVNKSVAILFKMFYYLLFPAISVSALLISESMSITDLYRYTLDAQRGTPGIVVLISLAFLSVDIVFYRVREWWRSFDELEKKSD